MIDLDNSDTNNKNTLWVFIVFCVFIAGGLSLAFISGVSTLKKGELIETDCYMHLIRATDLYETGNWYHPSLMETNTPFGDTSHWTRPFDVLLLAGAVPLSKWLGFESALFGWGIFISPVLLAITLIALFWAVKVLLSEDAPFFIVFVIAVQCGVIMCFKPARPDHHGFLALLFVLLVGFALRLATEPFKRSVCWLAAMTAAIAMWASVESLPVVSLIIAVIGFFWILREKDFLTKSCHFTVALFVFSCVCLLLERPLSDIKAAELDRFSIVYCVLFGLIAVFWVIASIIDRDERFFRSRFGRIVFTVPGCLIIALVLWFLYPKFYNGSLADIDPRIVPIWFSDIQELQPLLPKNGTLIPFVQTIGPLVAGLGFAGYVLFKNKDTARRNGWILLVILTAAFTFLAFRQVRWLVYPQILLSIPMAELLCRTLIRLKGINSVTLRALAKSAIISVFSVGFLFAGFFADGIFNRRDPENAYEGISLFSLCEHLNEKARLEDKNLSLLTHENFAGELLYRTRCEVVGSNYHRNAQGILDTYTFMTAKTDEEAFGILRRRNIDLVLLCPQVIEKGSPESSTFSRRLCEGTIPAWLKKVELPEGLSDDFLMFETDYSAK